MALRLISELDEQTLEVVRALRAESCRMSLHDGRGQQVMAMSFDRSAFAEPGVYEQALSARPAEPFYHRGHAYVRVEVGLEYEALLELARADGRFGDLLARLGGGLGPRSRLSPLAAR